MVALGRDSSQTLKPDTLNPREIPTRLIFAHRSVAIMGKVLKPKPETRSVAIMGKDAGQGHKGMVTCLDSFDHTLLSAVNPQPSTLNPQH